jgi:hypothetical protein
MSDCYLDRFFGLGLQCKLVKVVGTQIRVGVTEGNDADPGSHTAQ